MALGITGTEVMCVHGRKALRTGELAFMGQMYITGTLDRWDKRHLLGTMAPYRCRKRLLCYNRLPLEQMAFTMQLIPLFPDLPVPGPQ